MREGSVAELVALEGSVLKELEKIADRAVVRVAGCEGMGGKEGSVTDRPGKKVVGAGCDG